MTDPVPPARQASREEREELSDAQESGMQWFVIGLVGAAGLAALVAVAMIFYGGEGEDDDPDDLPANQARQASLQSGWRGPAADAGPGELIPQAVGAWDLQTEAADGGGANAMLGLDLPGSHGTYTRVGTTDSAELFAMRADAATAKAKIAAVREKVGDAARFPDAAIDAPALAGATETLRFDVPEGEGTPELHGLLAAADGWLFFARSRTRDDLRPFLAEYMKVVESDGTAEAPTDAPAPGGYRGLPDPGPNDTLGAG